MSGSGKEQQKQAVSSSNGHVAFLGAASSVLALKECESTVESGWDSSPPRGILKLLLIRAQTNMDLILPQRDAGCCYAALLGNKYRKIKR